MVKYTLYVDETGDTGLEKVRDGVDSKGASPFLVFGGCLVPEPRKDELKDLLKEVQETVGKADLHCSGLNHFQTARYAREVGMSARVKLFAFVSTKTTIGGYKQRIEGKGQDQKYYNKCVSYFLERVGHFMLVNEIDPSDLSVVFEKRDGHDYCKMRNYISVIKDNPNDPRLDYYLQPILPARISAEPKASDPLLSYADLVAFSVAAAVNASKANFGVPEQRYMRELKGKFFADEATGIVGEFGLKVFKRHSLKLDEETRRFIESWHQAGVEPEPYKSK